MQLNIQSIRPSAADAQPLDFSCSLDFSGLRVWGGYPFAHPVSLKGQVRREIDGLVLDYEIAYRGEADCARCLTPTCFERTERFVHRLLESEQMDDSLEGQYLPVADGTLDLAEIAAADLLLGLDQVQLCSPDCKGLCPKCGVDRNRRECTCRLTEPDPRFDVLRKLMEN